MFLCLKNLAYAAYVYIDASFSPPETGEWNKAASGSRFVTECGFCGIAVVARGAFEGSDTSR